MQTAVEFLIEGLIKLGYSNLKDWTDIPSAKKLIEQVKEMEKQQIIDAHKDGAMFEMDADKIGNDYYNETYGSKGSDEHPKVISESGEQLFFDKEGNFVTSSQTEISDEEIEPQSEFEQWLIDNNDMYRKARLKKK